MRPVDGVGHGELLGRGRQLTAIDGWLSDTREGRGQIVIAHAGAGLGKTTLLGRAAELADRAGMRVLRAHGGELEREVPFGAVRQLFEPLVRTLQPAERSSLFHGPAAHVRQLLGLTDREASAADVLGVAYGLYWLLADLSDRLPTLVVIDDLHWVDEHTMRWLAYLAPRVLDLPIFVLAAARPSEAGAEDGIAGLLDSEHTATLTLDPLNCREVDVLVRSRYGRSAGASFVAACHAATGGNPFFVQELLRAATQDGIDPVDAHAEALQHLGPREVARSILVRVARLGDAAHRLAEATAVLGEDAELRHAARLGGLEMAEALCAWDLLVGAQILEEHQPLRFRHPIARAAVYAQLAPGERTSMHRHVAVLLGEDDAPVHKIAVHAMACERAGDQLVVSWLRDAATDVLSAGAPEAAARFLARALQEPPAPDGRPQLRFELGRALLHVDSAAAAGELAAAAVDADPALALQAYRWRGYALAYAGRIQEAVASFDTALELAGADRERALLLRGTRDFYASWWADDPDREQRSRRLQEDAAELDGISPGERRVLAAAAINVVHRTSAGADRVDELTRRAGRAELSWIDPDGGDETAGAVGNALTYSDDDCAQALFTRWIAEVGQQGWLVNVGAGYYQRAQIHLRRGALLEAEADARTSWEILGPLGEAASTIHSWSLATLVQVLIARGALAEASAIAASSGLGRQPLDVVISPWPPVVRGELALACGDTSEGIEILLEAGGWLEQRGFTNPSYIAWRALVAPALAVSGRIDEASAIIAPALERARAFGAPWALGMTLRAHGGVVRGGAGLEFLREAVAVLEGSDCRLERMRALAELGAALRRDNHRAEAREHLRAAVELAHRCGAARLAQSTEQELFATGARPRRTMLTGPESLTATERRVADLASGGMSNPEIAQALFVSRKTIETHLGHVYMKLDIKSRDQLADVLDRPLE
jgi:DNA-binding CsgD family transcriptional regulator